MQHSAVQDGSSPLSTCHYDMLINPSICCSSSSCSLYLHCWLSTCLSHQASVLCNQAVCPEMVTQLRGPFFLLPPALSADHHLPPRQKHSPGENPLSPRCPESHSSHSLIVSTFSAFLHQIKVFLVFLPHDFGAFFSVHTHEVWGIISKRGA